MFANCFQIIANGFEIIAFYLEIIANWFEINANYFEIIANYFEIIVNYLFISGYQRIIWRINGKCPLQHTAQHMLCMAILRFIRLPGAEYEDL